MSLFRELLFTVLFFYFYYFRLCGFYPLKIKVKVKVA